MTTASAKSPSPQVLGMQVDVAGFKAMEEYVRAGQSWLREASAVAKLDFCALLGIHVKVPLREGGTQLLETMLMPFAFIKPLIDSLPDLEVARRLASFRLTSSPSSSDVSVPNQRRELASHYRRIFEFCHSSELTAEHLDVVKRALNLPMTVPKQEVLACFIGSFVILDAMTHLGDWIHAAMQHKLARAAPLNSSSPSIAPRPIPSNGQQKPLVDIKLEPEDDAGGITIEMLNTGDVKLETSDHDDQGKARKEKETDPARPLDPSSSGYQQHQSSVLSGRQSLKRPLPSTRAHSASAAPPSAAAPAYPPHAAGPVPLPVAAPFYSGPIHPSILSALQSSSISPQVLASLTGFGPTLYSPSAIQAKTTPSATSGTVSPQSTSSYPIASSALGRPSGQLTASGKYLPIHPAPAVSALPLPAILPFPTSTVNTNPPTQLTSSAPALGVLKRKAEKEAEEEAKRPLARTAPAKATDLASTRNTAISLTSSTSTSAPLDSSSLTSAIAAISISAPSTSTFSTPFCSFSSSFVDAIDTNPFISSSNGPFSPFSPNFSSPTSYSSTVISPSSSSSSLPSLSSSPLLAIPEDRQQTIELVGTETLSHGSRHYYASSFPEIEPLVDSEGGSLSYPNVDVIVVPKEEPETKRSKAEGDLGVPYGGAKSPTRSGRGRGRGRTRGGLRSGAASSSSMNARAMPSAGGRGLIPIAPAPGTATAPVLKTSRDLTVRVPRVAEVRAIATTHPVYKPENGTSASSNSLPPSTAHGPTSKSTTDSSKTKEPGRSDDEYLTAQLLISLGTGGSASTDQTETKVNKLDEASNTDGPLLGSTILADSGKEMQVEDEDEDEDPTQLRIDEEEENS